MRIIKTYGKYLENLSSTNPKRAGQLLKMGWQAQDLRFRLFPDKRLMPADRYVSRLMMDMMLKPLKKPEESAIVSIFTPCELIHEAGLNPYNVEAFSNYLSASQAERGFLQQAENSGISETLCSYHRVFIGAAEKGVLPRPKCIVYTNLICDANLLTFKYLAELYEAPSFFIDVPLIPGEENIPYVEDQLRRLSDFLMEHTGKTIDEKNLAKRLGRSRRILENYSLFQQKRRDKYVPTDLVTPLYCAMTNNLLLGTEEEEKYLNMLLNDIEQAQPAKGIRLYWMHTIPFWSEAVRSQLYFNEKAQIVGCELAQVFNEEFSPVNPDAGNIDSENQNLEDPGSENPYEVMARRLVYHALNGSGNRRIENGIRCAKEAGAHGAVWFNHWGCKHTMGNARLAKKKFEEAGVPMLILDSDGCDRSHGGEGQIATRLEAFLEMLEGVSHE